MKQINKELQERLLKGEIAIKTNIGIDKPKDLKLILESIITPIGALQYYYYHSGNWCGDISNSFNLPTYPLSSFFIEERKIVGYAAPFDMYGGNIKKGDKVKKNGDNSYENNYATFPAEWVEKEWQPISEEEKIFIGEYEVEFEDNKTAIFKVNNIPYHINELNTIKYLLYNNKDITSIKWHNADVTLETINKIIERLNK